MKGNRRDMGLPAQDIGHSTKNPKRKTVGHPTKNQSSQRFFITDGDKLRSWSSHLYLFPRNRCEWRCRRVQKTNGISEERTSRSLIHCHKIINNPLNFISNGFLKGIKVFAYTSYKIEFKAI